MNKQADSLLQVKTTDSTTSHLDLDSFVKAGWQIIGTEEFMEGDPPLKQTRYILGHPNPKQPPPKDVEKFRAALIESYKRKK